MVRRGQALLLLLVGGLVGAAILGAAMERDGLPEPIASRAAGLFAPSQSRLPARIEIGPSVPASVPASPRSPAAPGRPTAAAAQPTAKPLQPEAAATVVPPVVYTYPPEDHGGDGSGHGGGSGHSGS